MPFVNRDLSLLFQGLFERRLLLSVAHYIGLQLLILPNQAFVSDFQILDFLVKTGSQLGLAVKFDLEVANHSIERVSLLSGILNGLSVSICEHLAKTFQLACHFLLPGH